MSPESSPGWADGRPVSPTGGEFLRNFNGGGQPLNAGLNQGVPESQSEVTAMCDTQRQRVAGSAIGRPRWELLYAVTVPQLAALAAVEAGQSPHAARIAFRYFVTLGVFGAMSVWLRANRPSFDLQNWCDCAGERMTIRVIESHRPQPVALPLDHPATIADEVEEEYEVAAR